MSTFCSYAGLSIGDDAWRHHARAKPTCLFATCSVHPYAASGHPCLIQCSFYQLLLPPINAEFLFFTKPRSFSLHVSHTSVQRNHRFMSPHYNPTALRVRLTALSTALTVRWRLSGYVSQVYSFLSWPRMSTFYDLLRNTSHMGISWWDLWIITLALYLLRSQRLVC